MIFIFCLFLTKYFNKFGQRFSTLVRLISKLSISTIIMWNSFCILKELLEEHSMKGQFNFSARFFPSSYKIILINNFNTFDSVNLIYFR